MSNGYEQMVELLLSYGAQIPSSIQNILQSPDYFLCISKIFDILCERTDYEYAEVWYTHKNNQYLLPNEYWFAPENLISNELLEYRKNLHEDRIEASKSNLQISKVFETKTPISSHNLDENVKKNLFLKKYFNRIQINMNL